MQFVNDYDPKKDFDKNMLVIYSDLKENWAIQAFVGAQNLIGSLK